MQVLRLLEMVGLPELVIELASLAIMESVDDCRAQVQDFFCSKMLLQGPYTGIGS